MSMKYLASPPLRSARLILSAVALLTVIGGAAAAAAPAQAAPAHGSVRSAPAKPATFTWHPIQLINGWKSASKSTLVTGTPAWALSNGVVYLRGAIMQPNASGSFIAGQLPKSARPTRNLYLEVFTSSDVPGVLYIGANGTLEAYLGNSFTFTSLAAVSYPAATMKSRKISLEHGWTSSQSIYDTGDPSYAVSGGVVYLSGSMHRTGTSPVATLLPKAVRPAQKMFVPVYTLDGSTGWLQILPTGQLEVFGLDAAEYTSLAGISYPAVGAKWHNFALVDGWTSGLKKFHTAAPAYTVIGGVVYLTGSMYEATGNVGLWTFLPSAGRTAHDVLEIETDASAGTSGGVAITSSLGLVSSTPFANAKAFTSLASIAYPQSS
jgi:hypothetical protein